VVAGIRGCPGLLLRLITPSGLRGSAERRTRGRTSAAARGWHGAAAHRS